MDPVTHAAVGAVCAQSVSRSRKVYAASVFVAVMAAISPDVDVFWAIAQLKSDQLAFFKNHRYLTHSLLFMPMGALIVSSLMYVVFSLRISFRRAYIFSLLGYISHLLADLCTGYGICLLAPWRDTRFSIPIYGTIEPLFALPIWYLAYKARKFENRSLARYALLFASSYLFISYTQYNKVVRHVQHEHPNAKSISTSSWMLPTFWRVVYVDGDRINVDSYTVLLHAKHQKHLSLPHLKLQRALELPEYSKHKNLLRYLYRFFDDSVYVRGDRVYVLRWARSHMRMVDDIYFQLMPDGSFERAKISPTKIITDVFKNSHNSGEEELYSEDSTPCADSEIDDKTGRKLKRSTHTATSRKKTLVMTLQQ